MVLGVRKHYTPAPGPLAIAEHHGQNFRTLPNRGRPRLLGFGADQALNAREVARFLEPKQDAKSRKLRTWRRRPCVSIRKFPRKWLTGSAEIANIAQLVAQYFEGDTAKTALWFRTKNPLFGSISPRDMIRFGRYEKLRRFVTEALGQNAAVPPPREPRHAPAAQRRHLSRGPRGSRPASRIFRPLQSLIDSVRRRCIDGSEAATQLGVATPLAVFRTRIATTTRCPAADRCPRRERPQQFRL